MPRPKPSTDQEQHIIRTSSALWKKIVAAAAKAKAPSVNAYLNRLLEAATTNPAKGAVDTIMDTPPATKEIYVSPRNRAAAKAIMKAKATKTTPAAPIAPVPGRYTVAVDPATGPRVVPPATTLSDFPKLTGLAPRPYTGPITKESQTRRSPKATSSPKAGRR